MSYFVALGSLVGLLFISFFSSSDLDFKIFTWKHLLLFVQILWMSLTFTVESLGVKFLLFAIFGCLYVWAVGLTGFLTKEHILTAKRMILTKLTSLTGRFVSKG